MEGYLTMAEAAKVAGVSRQSMYQWAKALKFPTYRIEGAWRVKRFELEQYLETRPAVRVGSTETSTQEGAAGQ